MEVKTIGGLEIAYARSGRGSPLFLIHGYPLDHSIWNATAHFLQNDFEIFQPDVRGFGQSTPLDAPYTIADLADDLAHLLDALQIEKAYIAGHSMGGYIALAFANKYPSRVRGLALVASQAAADSEERKRGRYQTALQVEAQGVECIAAEMADKLSENQKIRETLRPLIEKQGKSGVAGALKAMAEREDTTALFATIDFPVVLIHGAADQLIPLERAEEIERRFPRARLVKLPGVGHMPMLDAAEKTAAALRLLQETKMPFA